MEKIYSLTRKVDPKPQQKNKKNIESEQLQNNSGNPKKTVELQDPNILLHDNETYN